MEIYGLETWPSTKKNDQDKLEYLSISLRANVDGKEQNTSLSPEKGCFYLTRSP